MPTSLVITLALLAGAPGPKDKPKEAPTIVGLWAVESAVVNGMPDKSTEHSSLELTADGKAVLKENGNDIAGSYKSDPKKELPEFDLTVGFGGMTTITMAGIYKLDGDKLTVCFALVGDRPKKLESPAGSNNILLTLKRTKKE